MTEKAHKESRITLYPDHVALIMDGNGRWAQSKGLSRSEGHKEGGETLDRLLNFAVQLPVQYFSLYAFSTENWKRPKSEITGLWKLMHEFFESRLQVCLDKGIKVVTSGDLSKLPASNRKVLEKVQKETEQGRNLTANFCINYGSMSEIAMAADKILKERLDLSNQGRNKEASRKITEKDIEKHLYTANLPPVDLLVRPGGEKRISNFLLWQSAYAELYFTDVLFPDFNDDELLKALLWFQGRKRRFGGIADGSNE